jgi:multiple sugar transport system permease protein
MSTTTEVPEVHTTREEVEKLAHPKRPAKQRVGVVLSYVGMAAIVLYCIIPFYWMIVSSLRLPTEGRSTEFIPSPASFENYQGVFAGQNNFGRSLINSVIVSGVTTLLTLVFGIIAAYALARLRFRGKGLVLWLIMACSMFPIIILIPPLLKMFSSTEPFEWFPRWIDTYQAVIIPGLSFALPLAVWNLTAFFKQLPVELEQAAMVDGCTPGVAFR